jgi:hypothetical protein
MTDNKNSSIESSEMHSYSGTLSMNARGKLGLISAIALKDLTQIHGSGFIILLTLSILLFALIGFPFFIFANAATGFGGQLHLGGAWTATGIEGIFVGSDPNRIFLSTITLVHLALGYSIVVTMILIPAAFSIAYGQEITKGTVRTLTCYPVGVFEITIAKLAYAAVISFIFGLPVFLLPTVVGLGKPVGDLFVIFIVAYFATLLIVSVGAFVANSITFVMKKMYIRPTLFANLLVMFSFLITSTILNGLNLFLTYVSPVFRALGELTPISLYHQGRLLLMFVFGGTESPNWLIFLLPVSLLVLGAWLTLKLWPDIYEKE